MNKKRQKQLKEIRSRRGSRKSRPPKINVLNLVLHLLLLLLIYVDARLIYNEVNGWNLREIKFAMAPKPENLEFIHGIEIKHLHYGQINIIVDKDGEYYVHFLAEYLTKEFDDNYQETNPPIGLNSDCLEWYSERELIQLLTQNLAAYSEFNSPAISFSLTPTTNYGDLIRILDILTYTKAMRYAWTPLTAEAKQALAERKKEPKLYYW
ncbi:MAG: hypothetical protein R8P61_30565 [Bacteroidia bacterium]|nr:hypothetical protein [Bacteroidia bacterium]